MGIGQQTNNKQQTSNTLTWIIGGSALILFGFNSLRHSLFQSTAFDLGYFEQAMYLIRSLLVQYLN